MNVRWSQVTALFGGTFDPPHLGHKEAIRGLFALPGVRNVLVIPSASPPHKPCVATAEQRLEMARIALTQDSTRIDPRELDRARSQPEAPTYSFETISDLRGEFPELAFVVGSDQFAKLPSWHRFPQLLGLCHWIVLSRKPEGETPNLRAAAEYSASGLLKPESSNLWKIAGTSRSLTIVPTEARAVSSTQIREELARSGNPPPGSLPPELIDYLKLHRIYGIQTRS